VGISTICSLLVLLPLCSAVPSLAVNTVDGPVRGGWLKSSSGAQLASYQGIPFAAPPLGNLRFGPPHPVTPWEDELDVSGISEVKCTQYGFMADGDNTGVSGSEDCLYLNVYVPESAGPDNKLPVMMWVFGGYFTAGSAQWTEYGAMNWADKDVIIVAPNHRLGPLGFTTFGNEEGEINPDAPGNQGLRDLVAALEWIQANIAEFGGDRDSVTIFGESSGSWACSYLHMSPLAKGLFHRAILQSGSMMNPFWLPHTAYDGIYQSFILGYALNCTDPTSESELLNCLREMPIDKLLETMEWGVEETLMIQKIFRPTGTIGDDFLPDWPANLMARGEYNHVDLMVGYTKDEALMQTLQLEQHPELYPLLAFQWYDVFGPMFLFGRYGPDITQKDKDMAAVLSEWYLGGSPILNINPDHFGNLTDLISDAYIWYGAYRESSAAVAHGDTVFQYQFNFKGKHGYPEAITGDNSKYGVCHSDELYYFWRPYWYKAVLDDVGFTPAEAEVSSNLLEMWSNFAKTGHPTPSGTPAMWYPVAQDSHNYLVIDTNLEMALTDEYLARMGIWEQTWVETQDNVWQPPSRFKAGSRERK